MSSKARRRCAKKQICRLCLFLNCDTNRIVRFRCMPWSLNIRQHNLPHFQRHKKLFYMHVCTLVPCWLYKLHEHKKTTVLFLNRRGVGRYSDFLSLRREHHNDTQFWVREKEDGKPISLFLCLCHAFFVLLNCQSVFNFPWYISNGQNIFSLTKKQEDRPPKDDNLFSHRFQRIQRWY